MSASPTVLVSVNVCVVAGVRYTSLAPLASPLKATSPSMAPLMMVRDPLRSLPVSPRQASVSLMDPGTFTLNQRMVPCGEKAMRLEMTQPWCLLE